MREDLEMFVPIIVLLIIVFSIGSCVLEAQSIECFQVTQNEQCFR